ncbi:sterol regulatory element-binding protein cleavage-activating protein isoform X2 [Anabrus simplex]|uniref:sterol regulatory element-binding protein cleavage-activating protein isoform X2 n=1 Tax=Anabrus simplex TaxID=316456 RepID=UPI0035A356C1
MASQNTNRSREPTRTLPERVGQVYYAHGLFCSSHPVLVISLAIAVVLLCCYPLLNLPLPGNVPQQLLGNLSVRGYNNSIRETGEMQIPRWYSGQPLVYVQQVVIKTAVCPWTEDMVLTDAFRAPLAEVFKLLEVVRNYQHENSSKTLSHLCLHVEAVKMKSDKKMLLPEYNCLVLSPANLWQQNREHFQEDPNLLSTIFNYQNLQKGKISLAEMLFGMNMKDTGIKRYPLRTRQRVLQFAITIILKDYDMQFLNGLRQKLISLYPLHQSSAVVTGGVAGVNDSAPDVLEVLHVYYPGEFSLQELVPFTVTCFILFLYMYFSVRKIELVKSKVGMAFSAVVTVLASLSMTIGLCFFFGLILTLNGKEVFPYLVAIVGLENVLVLTKSVVSTPTHLDVKIRVAQGLSREGWSITKNLLTEVTILTVGLFTFVPAIQEFCIFAIVGLLSDFFLQMFFFTTVLAIDIHRMELSSDSQHRRIHYNPTNASNPILNRTPLRHFRSPTPGNSGKLLTRSKSHPRLNGHCSGMTSSNYPTNVVAPPLNSPPPLVKLPKRLRLVHFWARTRIFQRGFMICMIVWIGVIVYNSGIMQQMYQVTSDTENNSPDMGHHTGIDETQDLRDYYTTAKSAQSHVLSAADRAAILDNIDDLQTLHSLIDLEEGGVPVRTSKIYKHLKAEVEDQPRPTDSGQDDLARLKHSGFDPWRRLSHRHWPAILSLYNMSVAGHYITILPAIRISHAVTPEMARTLRNLEEQASQHFQWQALAAALDPLDFSDGETDKDSPWKSFSRNYLGSDVPFIPTSPMEIFLTALLCIISVAVVAYMMVVLYRCVCSRNYAEWRASWAGECEQVADGIAQVVMEAVPLIMEGHQQEVECLATDGSVVVSSCLGGQVRVWDSLSGELLAIIDRKMYFSAMQKISSTTACGIEMDAEDLPLSDYESGSPPSRGETAGEDSSHCPSTRKTESNTWELPDLRSFINTNFTSRSAPPGNVIVPRSEFSSLVSKNGFDFGSRYKEVFRSYRNNSEFFSDDESDVEHQKNMIIDTFSASAECDQSASGNTRALLIPGRGKSEFAGYFPSKCVKSSDSNSVLSLRKKTKCSSDGTVDDELYVENSGGVSSRENVNHSFNTSYTSDIHNNSLSHFGSDLSKNCDIKCVNTKDNYTSNDSSTQNFSTDKFSYNVRTRDKSVSAVWSARNSQHLRYSASVDNSSLDGSCRTLQGSFHSMSGPSATSIAEKGRSPTDSAYVPPIWCVDCHENLVVLGCANGRLEFWEGSVGKFKCLFEDGSGIGVTAVKIIGNRVVAAKLSGAVDFLELESYSSQGRPLDWGFTSYRRRLFVFSSCTYRQRWFYIRLGYKKISGQRGRGYSLHSIKHNQGPPAAYHCT